MKFELKHSGDKHTLKVIPEREQELSCLMKLFHRFPDPAKGDRNPPHFHVKLKRQVHE